MHVLCSCVDEYMQEEVPKGTSKGCPCLAALISAAPKPAQQQGGLTPGTPCAAGSHIPDKVWGAGDDVLELREVDGAILVNVRLLQDLQHRH